MRPRSDHSLSWWWLVFVLIPAYVLHAAELTIVPQSIGLQAFQRGALEEAVDNWTAAARSAQLAGKRSEQITALEYLAQAYVSLGRYRRAIDVLEHALKLAESAPDDSRRIALLAALGNAHIAVGPPQTAESYLQRSLTLARQAQDAARMAAILNDLGNLYSSQQHYAQAMNAYQESVPLARRAERRLAAARALANLSHASRQHGKPKDADAALSSALGEVRQSPASHETVYTWIQIALASRELSSNLSGDAPRLLQQASSALNQAAAMAVNIGDTLGSSYAWGYLGSLYEHERRYAEAFELTNKAIFAAQRANAPESLYRWQWQSGRLLKHTASRDEAIPAFRRAIRTLDSIRSEFTATYGVPVTSFKDSVGAVYFEFVDLLFQRAASVTDGAQIALHLAEAREAVEMFKVAELRDYFRDECVDTVLRTTRLDSISPTAVVVYPVVLPDRTELLLSLPSGLKRVSIPVTADMLTLEVRQFRFALEKRTTREFIPHAQQLYRWLIAPIESELAAARVDTLVFVPDGPLRTIPMAALHDGGRFLIEKFAVGVTPGLNVTDPRPIARERIKVLAVGVTEPVQGFPGLPNVSSELDTLRRLFGSTTLMNEAFRLPAFERQLKEQAFNVVHIASHGEFGSDVKKTFLLAFDEKLTMDRLDQIVGLLKFRKEPLDLLTLSACETAAGDDRAALGLAGVAIKAGARSALATLWHINDEVSSELVAHFYREISEPSVSRAEALRRAQLKVLSNPRYDHPGFWSPFLMINNWL